MRTDYGTINIADRIMSALSYLSAGWLGIIYCIILHFAKKHINGFVRFNVMQSIFLALLYFVLAVLLNFTFSILSHIPLIQQLVAWIQLIFFRPVIWHYSLIGAFVTGVMIYLVVWSLLGRKPIIYGISKILLK